MVSFYQNSKSTQESVKIGTTNIVYHQIFPIIVSSVIILPENIGIENVKIDSVDNLQSTLKQNLTDSNKELELFNAISSLIVIANITKSKILTIKEEAELLIASLKNELKQNWQLHIFRILLK